MTMRLQHRVLQDLRPGDLVEIDGDSVMLVNAVGPDWVSFSAPTLLQRARFWLRRHICLGGFWARVWDHRR